MPSIPPGYGQLSRDASFYDSGARARVAVQTRRVWLQGNCSETGRGEAVAAMAGDLPGAPLLPMQGTQCLLLTYEDSLPVVSQ